MKKYRNLSAQLIGLILVLVISIGAASFVSVSAQGHARQLGADSPPWGPAAPRGSAVRLTFQGRLTSADGSPINTAVQVTGIRHDPYANAYRIPVEDDKPAAERGKLVSSLVRLFYPIWPQHLDTKDFCM